MIVSPGLFIAGSTGAEGTLCVLVAENRSADTRATHFISCAHVCSLQWINRDSCTDPLTRDPRSVRAQPGGIFSFLGPANSEELGDVNRHCCLKKTTSADFALVTLSKPAGASVICDPLAGRVDPRTKKPYKLEAVAPTDLAALANASVVRFGGKSGIATGALGGALPPTFISLPSSIGITYDNAFAYTCTPPSQPGDSGSMIALVSTQTSTHSLVRPIAIHVGVDLNGQPICYPLATILRQEWKLVYD
jgi:hypothetical protein